MTVFLDGFLHNKNSLFVLIAFFGPLLLACSSYYFSHFHTCQQGTVGCYDTESHYNKEVTLPLLASKHISLSVFTPLLQHPTMPHFSWPASLAHPSFLLHHSLCLLLWVGISSLWRLTTIERAWDLIWTIRVVRCNGHISSENILGKITNVSVDATAETYKLTLLKEYFCT